MKRETRHSEQCDGFEGFVKTDNTNSFSANSQCPNVSKLSYENKKRNKYRMLGTDLKRKAVYLVSNGKFLIVFGIGLKGRSAVQLTVLQGAP